MIRTPGLDVSKHQQPLDWAKTFAAGYSFAYIKVSEGETYRDPRALSHWQGARAAGLMVGGYHYYRPRKDPKLQAQGFASRLAELGAMDLPPVLDIETTDASASASAVPSAVILAGCQVFLAEVRRLTGWRPLVYSYGPFLDEQHLGALGADHELWLAGYVAEKKLRLPKGFGTWRIWQWSCKGEVPGAVGEVDLNWYPGSEQDLQNWARGSYLR